jgi:hypothetical protein
MRGRVRLDRLPALIMSNRRTARKLGQLRSRSTLYGFPQYCPPRRCLLRLRRFPILSAGQTHKTQRRDREIQVLMRYLQRPDRDCDDDYTVADQVASETRLFLIRCRCDDLMTFAEGTHSLDEVGSALSTCFPGVSPDGYPSSGSEFSALAAR